MRANDNPFAVHRVLKLRYRLDASEWRELLARLEQLNRRGALVGPCGSGKTTLLEDLALRLSQRGWRVHIFRLNADRRSGVPLGLFAENFGRTDFLLLDGAEQLSALAWWWFRFRTRSAGGLVITTHQPGRLPVLRRCGTSSVLLRELLVELEAPLPIEECEALHARHAGNLREAMRELYDRAAQR